LSHRYLAHCHILMSDDLMAAHVYRCQELGKSESSGDANV
jgi:hypothetical protein